MNQAKIDRINEFARRVKRGETLTPAELRERDALRREPDVEEIFRMVDEKTFIPYHKSLIELLFRLKDGNRMHTYQEA